MNRIKEMVRYRIVLLQILFGLGLMYQCANPVAPTGGPDDTMPPQLLIEESTPNQQTMVKPKKIVLKFDEWVVVRSPSKEIIVSPPLQYTPKVATKGKGVVLTFDDREILRDSTTYVINFGESIQDLTAGNAFKDFNFVFATGSQLDKETIKGKLIDAHTGVAAKGAIAVLYDEIQDSVIFNQRPIYFTNVQDDGSYQFEYLRADTFLLFALVDENRNYYLDQDVEKFGYYPHPIHTGDTLNNTFNFSMYQPVPSTRVLTTDDNYKGKFTLATTGINEDMQIRIHPEPQQFIKRIEKDSILYYFTPVDSFFTFYAAYGEKQDTLKYKPAKKQKEIKLNLMGRQAGQKFTLTPERVLDMSFSLPIKAYDLSKFEIMDTSDLSHVAGFTSLDEVGIKWRIDIVDDRSGPQSLSILPGGLIDFYGRTSEDTISILYTPLSPDDVSVLNIEINNLDSAHQYIVLLMQGEELIHEYIIRSVTSTKWEIGNLIPGQYALQLIEDKDLNKEWSGGNYIDRTEPEKIMHKSIEPLRANWDVEVTIEWN